MRTKRKTTPIGRVEQFVKQGGLQEYAETNYEELFNENSSDENFIFVLYSAATANLRGIYWEPIEKEWLIRKLINDIRYMALYIHHLDFIELFLINLNYVLKNVFS